MDALTLFPDVALDARSPGPNACRAPIVRRGIGHRRRARSARPRHPSVAVMLLELSQVLERQHVEVMCEIGRLQQRRRNEHEALPMLLKRVTEIARHLRLTETPQMPRATRRHPMGA
jgi:hypothetical protein